MRSQIITPDQLAKMPGKPHVQYLLDRPPYTAYFWDGAKMVESGGTVSGGGIPNIRPRIALLGDSIMNQTTNTAYLKYAAGAVNWMMARLGHPWYLPISNNFAVGGTTTDVMIANQLPLLLAAHASKPVSRCFISAGTNDSNAGNPLATIKYNLQSLFEELLNAGIMPAHHGILPRGNDGADTNAKKANRALNEWMQWYAYTRGGLEFIDCGLAIANNATAFGNALTTMTDGTQLHPIDPGAFHLGRIMADYYTARGVGKQVRYANSQADKYDATYNPTGVIFDSPNPLLQGGTTAPTGMTTSGGTWAVGTQTLANGQTKPTVACTLASSATQYLYDDALATGGFDSENLREGDYVYGICEIQFNSVVSLNSCQLKIVENDGATTTTTAFLSPGVGSIGAPENGLTLHMMTPPILVRPYAGSGSASVFMRQEIVTGAAETGNAVIKGFEMRKWVGEI